jgi:hypothetical protein
VENGPQKEKNCACRSSVAGHSDGGLQTGKNVLSLKRSRLDQETIKKAVGEDRVNGSIQGLRARKKVEDI